MAQQNRETLKQQFETNDTLTEEAFENLIDSFYNLQATTAQNSTSNLTVPGLGATTVSADSVYADSIFVAGIVRNQNPFIDMYCPATEFETTVSAGSGFVALDITTSAQLSEGFSQTSGVATYTGTVTANFEINSNIVVSANEAFTSSQAAIFVNGSMVPSSRTVFAKASGRSQSIHMNCVAEIKPNDTVDFRFSTNASSAVDFQHSVFNMVVKPINFS